MKKPQLIIIPVLDFQTLVRSFCKSRSNKTSIDEDISPREKPASHLHGKKLMQLLKIEYFDNQQRSKLRVFLCLTSKFSILIICIEFEMIFSRKFSSDLPILP